MDYEPSFAEYRIQGLRVGEEPVHRDRESIFWVIITDAAELTSYSSPMIGWSSALQMVLTIYRRHQFDQAIIQSASSFPAQSAIFHP